MDARPVVKSHTQGVFDWEFAASLLRLRKDLEAAERCANTLPGRARRRRRHDRRRQRHRLEHAGGEGHLAALGPRAAHRRLRPAAGQLPLRYRRHRSRGTGSPTTQGRRCATSAATPACAASGRRTPGASPAAGRRCSVARSNTGTHDGRALSFATPVVDSRVADSAANRTSRRRPRCPGSGSPTRCSRHRSGRAVRFPTVAELYGATVDGELAVHQRPDLRPERSWTGELIAGEGPGQRRSCAPTLFSRETRTTRCIRRRLFDAAATATSRRVQNVGRIAHAGLELAYTGADVGTARAWT